MDTKLFEISDLILNSLGQNGIQISSNFITSLDDSGKLQIFSITKNQIILQETNVSAFTWINTTSFPNPILAILENKKIKFISFTNHLAESVPFDITKRLAEFSIQKLNDNCSTICEFNLDFSFQSFISFDSNSLLILDDSDTLHHYLLFPDGLYSIKSESAKGCISFTYSGLYLAGQSSNEIHLWTSNLNYICSTQANGSHLCPISANRFASINSSEKVANLITFNSFNSNIDTEIIQLKEETDFISIVGGTVYEKPPNSNLVTAFYFSPLFQKEKAVFTFDNEVFIQMFASTFPPTFTMPWLIQRSATGEAGILLASRVISKARNAQLFESFLNSCDPKSAIIFLKNFSENVLANLNEYKKPFLWSIYKIIKSFSVPRIQKVNDSASNVLSTALINFRNIFYPIKPVETSDIPPYKTVSYNNSPSKVKKENLLEFVLSSLENRQITESLYVLKNSFPEFHPFYLFRTLILQQAWLKVCNGRLKEEAKPLLIKLGEDPNDHFYHMWKSTTRNMTRQVLYEYLVKEGKILQNSADERHHKILKAITDRYPNTSFVSKVELMQSSSSSFLYRSQQSDDSELPQWQPIFDIKNDFNENESLIFSELFPIQKEAESKSPHYFVGNILLIESQEGKGSLDWLLNKDDPIVTLFKLHCENRIGEMVAFFDSDLKKPKSSSRDKLDCIRFVDKYYDQLNTYELETLLDMLCIHGYFAEKEYENFELLLVRICKNKFLFDENWWTNQAKIDFSEFFIQFCEFCSKKSLFMPFEMFVLAHQKQANEMDVSEIKSPMIQFIWNLWMKRDPSAANLSCMQFIANSNTTDPVELWEHLPKDSLAPLASFVWNKDPKLFNQGSRELVILAERLREDYPLLASIINNEIPHPHTPVKRPQTSKWRTPIYTSKYDLELHDLIQSHFANYDFSKVFTNYYRKNQGEDNFPHFDHPQLITKTVEPPYAHYVKLKLPVSAFQQAVEDGLKEDQFKEISLECMKEALINDDIRLAVLSFIELVDMKFKWDHSIDFKIAIQLHDILIALKIDREKIIDLIVTIYNDKDKIVIKELKRYVEQSNKDVKSFLLSALLGFRGGLPLDYQPIIYFAENRKSSELLLFIDEAAELGLHYSISEVEKIVEKKMPLDEPLRAHILFHLKQSLPSEEGSIVTDIPALIVYRAVKKKDQPPDISLLQEALKRKVELYALLATSIKGANLMLCAYVTMLTMTTVTITFDVTKPPEHEQFVTVFLETLFELLNDKKSLELMQTLELFSENSIAVNLIIFYRSIELFAFKRTESILQELNSKLAAQNVTINDDLLGEVSIKIVTDIFFQMLDKLTVYCAKQSQIHLFQFLRVLDGSILPESLQSRVSLCRVISSFKSYRRAIVRIDLLGPSDKLINDITLNHSLAMGQEAAKVLSVSSESATKEWLSFQYSNATTPLQVIEIHEEIVSSIKNVDPMFFIYLFCSLLPYEQPTHLIIFVNYSKNVFMKIDSNSSVLKYLNALLLHLNICKENKIEVIESPGGLPSLKDLLKTVFPGQQKMIDESPNRIQLSIETPVLYGLDTLQRFFETSVDKVIDICLDRRESDKAHLICEWRNRDPKVIQLLEAVQCVISDEKLTDENRSIIEKYGDPTVNMDEFLQAIAESNGWRFVIISLHYKAAKILSLSTKNLLQLKTSDFIQSPLAVDMNHWDLIRSLIKTSKMSSSEVASCLGHSYSEHVKKCLLNGLKNEDTKLKPDDYNEHFIQFIKLCDNPAAVGEKLFEIAKKGSKVQLKKATPPMTQIQHQHSKQIGRSKKLFLKKDVTEEVTKTNSQKVIQKEKEKEEEEIDPSLILPVKVVVNLLLHASLCTADIDEIAELLDALLLELTDDSDNKMIINIVSIFPDPSLIPRFFQYLIAQKKLNDLPHQKLNEKVGRVIMNCARHHHPFEPQKYLELTLKYNLFRDHAELQMMHANRLLEEENDDNKNLQEASHHFLMALAYFLHEKCYSLSMECLKKLSLISLQLQFNEPSIMNIDKQQVQQLMNTRDFPFALTVAVAYDMDNEANWSEVIFNQTVVKQGEDFLTDFQFFRPITSTLCDGVVRKYKAANLTDGMQDRMKAFLTNIPNLVERYRIAKSLDFKDMIDSMKEHNPVVCEWCERVLMSKQ